MKVLDFLCFNVAVGHADTNLRQFILQCINIGIALRLGKMNRFRRFNPF